MAWVTLAEGKSLDEFRNAAPTIADLPKWTRLKLRIELPVYLPFGKLADLAGMEWWAQQLVPHGIVVDDVYGNWTWIEVLARVDPPMLPAYAIAAIAIAVAALPFGIAFLISSIRLEADMLGGTLKWGSLVFALVIGLVLYAVLKKEK